MGLLPRHLVYGEKDVTLSPKRMLNNNMPIQNNKWQIIIKKGSKWGNAKKEKEKKARAPQSWSIATTF